VHEACGKVKWPYISSNPRKGSSLSLSRRFSAMAVSWIEQRNKASCKCRMSNGLDLRRGSVRLRSSGGLGKRREPGQWGKEGIKRWEFLMPMRVFI